MNTVRLIEQWCAAQGYTFIYGSASQINERLTYADYSASAGGVVVFATLLTSGAYDNNKDHDNVAVYFSSLADFDFDPLQVADLQNSLKETSKGLLQWLQSGNEAVWSGARYTYGYDDYAENICWCCLRFTLDSIAADCVPLPEPPALQVRTLPVYGRAAVEALGYIGTLTELCDGIMAVVYDGQVSLFTIVAMSAAAGLEVWLVDENGNVAASAAGSGILLTQDTIAELSAGLPDGMREAAVTELEGCLGWWLAAVMSDPLECSGLKVQLRAGGTADNPEWSGEWCEINSD